MYEFRTGNGADMNHEGGWGEEKGSITVSPSSISASTSIEPDILSTGFAREYTVLAGIAANMRSGFILLNQREHIAYSNPSAVRLLGMSNAALVEQPVFDIRKHLLTIAADPQHVQTDLDQLWLHPEQECSLDIALADAAVRWLHIHCFPVRDVPGHLLGRGVLLDDMTLEHSAMQSRSEALTLAAHELKTPLAIIKGCATTLLSSSTATRWDPAVQREMLQMIDTHTDRLHDVLNTLLDVWRLDGGVQTLRLSQVQLSQLLNQVVERWKKQAPPYRYSLSVQSELPLVLCDAVRLEQVFNHLLNNAVLYSPEGGTINIQLESNEIEMRLSIIDEGIGIVPEDLERIFERFYRVAPGEEQARGNGLGLAVARATIEAHGGKIWAASPGLGCGATFYCTLPFSPPSPGSASPAHAQQATSPSSSGPLALPRTGPLKASQGPSVLLAEHDARILRYLRAHLEEQHYHVQTVTSGVQCLRQLELGEPDVILLATRLADISGSEVLQRLREFVHTPVMMLCDDRDDDEEERVRLFDLGADDLVSKPFRVKELLARVRALLRRQTAPEESSAGRSIFTTGNLSIDYAQHLVSLKGEPIKLSRTEYKLLSTLAKNVGMVVTHELLLERVWGPEYSRDIGFIWVYISRLRHKIEADPRHPHYILTVPDVGYKLAKL